jgi:signal peptidase I
MARPSAASGALRAALCVGLGHLYLGRPRAAGVLLFAMIAGCFGSLVAWAYLAGAAAAVLAGAAALLWAAQVVAVLVAARRAAGDWQPPGLLRTVAFYVAAWAISLLVGRGLVKPLLVESFVIQADSMAPALLSGDHVLAVKRGGRARAPAPGDVIAFAGADGRLNVKRVVARAGQRVESREGWLFVDDAQAEVEPCAEPEAPFSGIADDGEPIVHRLLCFVERGPDGRSHEILRDPERETADFGPVLVPAGAVFVLGDHRDDSRDSRHFGPVPVDRVIGRVAVIWWSAAGETVRWERVGERL